MATPPFDIDQTVPADNGVVSQFPLQERTYRDVVESWLTTEHNTSGQHNFVTLPQAAAPAAPGASLTRLWADTSGNLSAKSGASGAAETLIPAGMMGPWPTTTPPAGWHLANGQAVSRTTYSRLFALIGTTFGAGDGSTTFNVPDIRGRTIVGSDTMGSSDAGRLSGATFPTSGGVNIGEGGGAETITLVVSNMPSHAHPGSSASGSGTTSIQSNGHTHTFSGATSGQSADHTHSVPVQSSGTPGGVTNAGGGGWGGTNVTSSGTSVDHTHTYSGTTSDISASHTHTVSVSGIASIASQGGDAAHSNMPPAIIMYWIIKW